MSALRTLIILAGAVALASCGPMGANNTKNAPTAETPAPTAADAGAKPDEAAPAASTDTAAKPEEPTQAPSGAAADKPA